MNSYYSAYNGYVYVYRSGTPYLTDLPYSYYTGTTLNYSAYNYSTYNGQYSSNYGSYDTYGCYGYDYSPYGVLTPDDSSLSYGDCSGYETGYASLGPQETYGIG